MPARQQSSEHSQEHPRFLTLWPVVWVGLGGMVGTLTRASLDLLAGNHAIGINGLLFAENAADQFMLNWSTVLVNILGAFGLAYMTAYMLAAREGRLTRALFGFEEYMRREDTLMAFRWLAGTGFFGSFTTYSTFILALAQPTFTWWSLLEGVVLLMTGIFGVIAGFWLSDAVHADESYISRQRRKQPVKRRRKGPEVVDDMIASDGNFADIPSTSTQATISGCVDSHVRRESTGDSGGPEGDFRSSADDNDEPHYSSEAQL